eukprot:TRINITY_DN1073_c3_g1_i2.p1 TRINITY_DN1073_c3_g1~~TRINITY_DN1073_c3_g1_i2.p1  ORF type:complete len:369 (-),score=-50.06 TRINITY_DN1073_c3_g1_i2:233-1339(-)
MSEELCPTKRKKKEQNKENTALPPLPLSTQQVKTQRESVFCSFFFLFFFRTEMKQKNQKEGIDFFLGGGDRLPLHFLSSFFFSVRVFFSYSLFFSVCVCFFLSLCIRRTDGGGGERRESLCVCVCVCVCVFVGFCLGAWRVGVEGGWGGASFLGFVSVYVCVFFSCHARSPQLCVCMYATCVCVCVLPAFLFPLFFLFFFFSFFLFLVALPIFFFCLLSALRIKVISACAWHVRALSSSLFFFFPFVIFLCSACALFFFPLRSFRDAKNKTKTKNGRVWGRASRLWASINDEAGGGGGFGGILREPQRTRKKKGKECPKNCAPQKGKKKNKTKRIQRSPHFPYPRSKSRRRESRFFVLFFSFSFSAQK